MVITTTFILEAISLSITMNGILEHLLQINDSNEVQEGWRNINDALNCSSSNHREYYLNAALQCFSRVSFNNAYNHIKAPILYGQAVCHALQRKFELALGELEQLESISENNILYTSKTIKKCKEGGRELKRTIYIALNRNAAGCWWILAGLLLICAIILGITYFFFEDFFCSAWNYLQSLWTSIF